MAPSNRYSHRRRVFRRPPVCRSKPKPDDDPFAGYPPYVNFTFNWLIGFAPPNISQYTATLQKWLLVPGTGRYGHSGNDTSGNGWSGVFSLFAAPTVSTFQITILAGPFLGRTLTAIEAIAGPLNNFTFPLKAFTIFPAGGSGQVNGIYP